MKALVMESADKIYTIDCDNLQKAVEDTVGGPITILEVDIGRRINIGICFTKMEFDSSKKATLAKPELNAIIFSNIVFLELRGHTIIGLDNCAIEEIYRKIIPN